MRYTGVLRKRTQRASVNQSEILFSVPRKGKHQIGGFVLRDPACTRILESR